MNLSGETMYIGSGMRAVQIWDTQSNRDMYELRNADDEVIGNGKWECVFKAAEGIALAFRKGRAYYIRPTGQIIHEGDWLNAGCFSEGWAVCGDRTGKYGDASVQGNGIRLHYFDLDGKIRHRLDSQWREARGFHEGLAAVARGNNPYRLSWGYINKTFEVQIDPVWDRAHDFSGGIAVVEREHRFSVIDKRGRVLTADLETYPPDDLLHELRERVMANE